MTQTNVLVKQLINNLEETRTRPIKLFKLHLFNLRKEQRPLIPPQLHYKKAIEDYFSQMRILIKSSLERR
jgi:hypothetical protein